MLQSVSPYALLCASKPKPAPAIVTAYDLYSQAQCAHEQASASGSSTQAPIRQPDPAPLSVQNPRTAARRTHYIADINSRHSAAIHRTPMQTQPLT